MKKESEKIILEEGQVKVTDQRVIVGTEIGTQTYAIPNISAVNVDKRTTNYTPLFLVASGVALTVSALIDLVIYVGCEVLGLLLVSLGLVSRDAARTSYIVRIRNAAGEASILESHDEAHVKRIVEAMNEAMENRV